MAHPTVREAAAVYCDQQGVWAAVRSGSRRAPDPGAAPPVLSQERLAAVGVSVAPTGSYRGLYQAAEVAEAVEPFAAQLREGFEGATAGLDSERVVGVVVAYGGEIVWSDEFASPDPFERYWPKLLRSYVIEALARSASHEVPTIESARRFPALVHGVARIETAPGVYRRAEVTRGRDAEVVLDGLTPGVSTVHRTRMNGAG